VIASAYREQAMDILKAVSVELPCNQCGQRYQVTLEQILLSQDALGHDCLARGETECEPLFHARLLDHELIAAFLDAWNRLGVAAQASGGALRVQDVPDEM
jgi:hypothetical protein